MPQEKNPTITPGSLNWEEISISDELLSLIPIESIERYKFAPYELGVSYVNVAVVDINDINTQNALRFFGNKIGKEVRVLPIGDDEFKLLLKKFKNPSIEIERVLSDLERVDEEDKSESKKELAGRPDEMSVLQEAPVAKMVEVILKNAIDGKASDIHIEPMEGFVRVRYRVDGVLYNSITLPSKVGPAIVSRIKILSNLKIDEKRKPQDGRFRITDLGKMIDFRVSTFPVANGEKVVMRILDKTAGLIDLEQLGFFGRDLEMLKKVIEEPFGIVLVTGPTGSGKSTTLYSVLNILNREGVNIVTLEDPVEYVLEGISQSQVRPEIGYTFASGLRSILRQDPDIVMVGEIRDNETAELAIHAALTGHLVFSTLHTNTAVGAVPRLVDMGIQPFLISSSLKLVIAQRLVRRICPDCKTKREDVTPEMTKMIMDEVKRLPESKLKEIGMDRNNPKIELFYGKGCSQCHNKGMKGRIGIYEVLVVTDVIARMFTTGMRESEIEKQARNDGYATMKEDGIIKVLQGVTTLEEVQRVTEEASEEEVID